MDQQDDRPVPLPEAEESPAKSAHTSMLLGSIVAFTVAAALLLVAPLVSDALPVLALSCLAGVLLLTAAGFGAALLIVQSRAGRTRNRFWPQTAVAIGGGALSATIVLGAWRAAGVPPAGMLLGVGGGVLVLAFPVLVLERAFAGVPDTVLAEAAGLAALLRAVLIRVCVRPTETWSGVASSD